MKNNVKWLIGAAVVVVAGVMFLGSEPTTGDGGGERIQAGTARGATAPGFSLPEYQSGKTVNLADYQDKVVLVNFWATWCPPCRQEIPDFLQVRNDLAPQGFEILGISLDAGGAADVAPFAKEYGITYPVLIGNQAVTEQYGGIRGIPASFLVDRQGKIVQTWTGAIDRQTLEDAVKPLL